MVEELVLRAFEQVREVYLSELGTEPGEALRSMRDRIVANDSALHWHPGQSAQENRAINAGSDITVASSARVVYVDRDPMVVAYSRASIEDSRNTTYILGDLRNPAEIFAHPQTRRLIDPDEPVGVLMLAVLHFLPADEAHLSLEQVRAWMPPGSALAISHLTRDGSSPEVLKIMDQVMTQSTAELVYLRSRPEIEGLFTGLEPTAPLDEPGNWQTDQQLAPCSVAILAGVAFRT